MMNGDPESRRGRLAALTSVDALHILVLLVLLGISPLSLLRTDAGWWLPVGYASLLLGVVLMATMERRHAGSRFARIAHFWYPIPYVMLIFWRKRL